jgi:drug/metabolite transporter (DMT)-like permease
MRCPRIGARTRYLSPMLARITRTDVLLFTMALIWGVNYSVVKLGAQVFPPLAFNAMRVAIAGAVLMALAAMTTEVWPSRRDTWRLLALGALGNCVYQVFFIEAIARARAGSVAIVLASSPAWLALGGRLRGTEHVSRRTMAGIAASIAGVGLVVIGGAGSPEPSSPAPALGNMLALLGCIAWAIYTVLLKPLTHHVAPLQLAGLTMAGGAVPLLLLAAPSLATTSWSSATPAGWGALAYGSLVALVIAYLLWYHGVRVLGPTRTAMYANLQPIIALVVAAVMLGEQPTPWQAAGIVAIMSGLLLTR